MDNGGNLSLEDANKLILVDSSSNQILYLPSDGVSYVGLEYKIVKIGSGRLTIVANTGDSINDGSASGTIYCSETSPARLDIMLVCGSLWQGFGNNIWVTT